MHAYIVEFYTLYLCARRMQANSSDFKVIFYTLFLADFSRVGSTKIGSRNKVRITNGFHVMVP